MSDTGIIARWKSWAPWFLSFLRIIAALLFMQSGGMKLLGFPAPMPEGMTLEPGSQIWLAGILELYGGGLMLLGLAARPVAFILSGMMAVAYFQAHAPKGFWPMINGGDSAVMFCFVWLYFSAAGPGPLSLDALIGRRRSAAREH
jgi:putative oxidoreductase